MTAFVLSPEAEDDIWNIWQYLALEAGQSIAGGCERCGSHKFLEANTENKDRHDTVTAAHSLDIS